MKHLPASPHQDLELTTPSLPCNVPERPVRSPCCERTNISEAFSTRAVFSSIVITKSVFSLKPLLLNAKRISVPTYRVSLIILPHLATVGFVTESPKLNFTWKKASKILGKGSQERKQLLEPAPWGSCSGSPRGISLQGSFAYHTNISPCKTQAGGANELPAPSVIFRADRKRSTMHQP